ncbi:hypothetical protein HDU81_002173 [Chytriomyces hyalinus]|nr:hypothetical protein HDU81_002173 [Chytriomyces hyalinus]
MPVANSRRMMARRQLLDLNLGLLGDPNAGKGKKGPLPAAEPVPNSAPAAASKQQKKQKGDKQVVTVPDPLPIAQVPIAGQSLSDGTLQQQQPQPQPSQAQPDPLSQNQARPPNQDSQAQVQVQQQPVGQGKSESAQVSSDQGSAIDGSVQKGDMAAVVQATTGNKIKAVEVVEPKSIVRASTSGNLALQEIQATPYPSLAGSNSSGQDVIPPTNNHGPPIGLIVGISIAAILLIAGLVYVCYRRMRSKRGNALTSKSGWVPPVPYKQTEEKESTVGVETRLNTLTNLKQLPNLYNLAIRNSSISSKLSPPPKDAPQERFTVHTPPAVVRESRISNRSADLELGLEPDVDVKPLSQTSNVSYRVSVLYANDDFEVDTDKMEFVGSSDKNM